MQTEALFTLTGSIYDGMFLLQGSLHNDDLFKSVSDVQKLCIYLLFFVAFEVIGFSVVERLLDDNDGSSNMCIIQARYQSAK